MLQRDPFDHHHQFWPVNRSVGSMTVARRQLKGTTFQPFIVENKTPILPVEQFHMVTALVDKYEHLSRQGIALHPVLYQPTQAIKPHPHIGG
jgi:hypothetical protein